MNVPADQTTEACRLCSYTINADESEIDLHKHILDEHSLRERLLALHETVTISEEEA